MSPQHSIGLFDSGIGGLSVLRHLQTLLPHESFLYFSDHAYAPYGDQPEQLIVARSLAIADFLIARGAKALVVSCNTATAAAIVELRQRFPDLPLVGIEPGLKPAAALSVNKIIGVLATASTLASKRFEHLRERIEAACNVRFLLQACVGLADQIERQEKDCAITAALVTRYVTPLIEQGADMLVLGCTHYPFVAELIQRSARAAGAINLTLIDTGLAVAAQTQRLLLQRGLLNSGWLSAQLTGFSSADCELLERGFANLLGSAVAVERVDV